MRGRNKPDRGRAALGAGLASLGPAAAWAEMRVNLPEGVTPISHEVYDLHMLILAICAAIGVFLFAVMFYSIYAHRRSEGAVAVQFHENALVEILWTVVPFVILVAMAVPATKSMISLHDTGAADVTVKVTGYQWKWQYEYLEDGIKFVSNLKTPSEQIYDGAAKGENYLLEVDNPLVLPVNKKVRFLITAADVLHAWWVPEFGWKQDATPGFVNEGWARIEKPGTYRGQCTELCGRGHGFMPIVVEARSEAEYAEWVEDRKEERAAAEAATGQTFTMEQLMEEGAKVYNASCAACHQAKGQGVPGAFPPLAGSAIAKGPVGAHMNIVLNGRPNTAMMPFGGQLDDLHIAAVVTYERNAFGNEVGDRVQPADVKAARGR
jgi:cytochrome c oxidase subunit II